MHAGLGERRGSLVVEDLELEVDVGLLGLGVALEARDAEVDEDRLPDEAGGRCGDFALRGRRSCRRATMPYSRLSTSNFVVSVSFAFVFGVFDRHLADVVAGVLVEADGDERAGRDACCRGAE